MVDRLKPERDWRPDTAPSPLTAPQLAVADRGGRAAALLIGLLLAAVAWLGWEAFGPEDLGDPVATSILAFEKQNELTVFSAQLSPVVAAEDSRYFDMVQSRQVAVIPATVRYTLDLSQMNAADLEWDEAAAALTVTIPDVGVSQPNLDEARAQYLREGIWISREAQDSLDRQNTLLAERQAREQARNPVLMGMARQAAREAVAQNLAIPLQVAGFGTVAVSVRFEDETEERP